MDRWKLSQYMDAIAEYKELKKELENLERGSIVSDTVKGSSPHFPYMARTVFIEGIPSKSQMRAFKRTQMRLETTAAKVFRLKEDVEEFIESIEDIRTRRIFRKRYIDGKTWECISMELHSTSRWYARNIHDRYLQKINQDKR